MRTPSQAEALVQRAIQRRCSSVHVCPVLFVYTLRGMVKDERATSELRHDALNAAHEKHHRRGGVLVSRHAVGLGVDDQKGESRPVAQEGAECHKIGFNRIPLLLLGTLPFFSRTVLE